MNICIIQVALCHGGAEQVGVLLANGFYQKGHNVTILSDLNEPIDYIPNKEIKLHGILKSRNCNVLNRWFHAIVEIRKFANKEKPDIMIGIMGLCTFVTYIACVGLKIPIVMTEHNSFERPASAPMPLSIKIFKFWINKLYKNITVLTEADKKVIGNRLKNVTVMPNPLLLKPIKYLSKKKNIVLAVGRVDAWHVKGFDTLICAWQKLVVSSSKIKDSSWCLKIAGAGKKESFEYLMNLLPDGEWVFNDDDNCINTKYTKEKNTSAKKHNSQKSGVWRSEKYHIEFLGFQKDMESIYKKSEIFVLSSRYEGFGLVLIEAMSQGCAPVACDFKGRQKEILKPNQTSYSPISYPSMDFQKESFEICENGILCKPDNVETLAQALEKMIKDENYRFQVQKKAVERSKLYSLDNIIKKWEKYIDTIVLNDN